VFIPFLAQLPMCNVVWVQTWDPCQQAQPLRQSLGETIFGAFKGHFRARMFRGVVNRQPYRYASAGEIIQFEIQNCSAIADGMDPVHRAPAAPDQISRTDLSREVARGSLSAKLYREALRRTRIGSVSSHGWTTGLMLSLIFQISTLTWSRSAKSRLEMRKSGERKKPRRISSRQGAQLDIKNFWAHSLAEPALEIPNRSNGCGVSKRSSGTVKIRLPRISSGNNQRPTWNLSLTYLAASWYTRYFQKAAPSLRLSQCQKFHDRPRVYQALDEQFLHHT
jgi:hypothetical protein